MFAQPLARWLEEWLELLPHDKVLFGSDASYGLSGLT
jgi:predicted TIM-barrel fold metal-dependent hydrolase